MLQKAFESCTLFKTRVYEWHKYFKRGRMGLRDLTLFGHPSVANTEENIEKMKGIVLENLHTSLREFASKLNIAHGTAQHIVVNVLGIRHVEARLIPKDLTFVQIHHLKTVAEESKKLSDIHEIDIYI